MESQHCGKLFLCNICAENQALWQQNERLLGTQLSWNVLCGNDASADRLSGCENVAPAQVRGQHSPQHKPLKAESSATCSHGWDWWPTREQGAHIRHCPRSRPSTAARSQSWPQQWLCELLCDQLQHRRGLGERHHLLEQSGAAASTGGGSHAHHRCVSYKDAALCVYEAQCMHAAHRCGSSATAWCRSACEPHVHLPHPWSSCQGEGPGTRCSVAVQKGAASRGQTCSLAARFWWTGQINRFCKGIEIDLGSRSPVVSEVQCLCLSWPVWPEGDMM